MKPAVLADALTSDTPWWARMGVVYVAPTLGFAWLVFVLSTSVTTALESIATTQGEVIANQERIITLLKMHQEQSAVTEAYQKAMTQALLNIATASGRNVMDAASGQSRATPGR